VSYLHGGGRSNNEGNSSGKIPRAKWIYHRLFSPLLVDGPGGGLEASKGISLLR